MSRRAPRLADAIRKAAAAVAQGIPLEECGIVSITGVDVSPECSHATVYVSAFDDGEKAVRYMIDNQRHVKAMLGTLVKINRLPELRFMPDEAIRRANRIDALLD